MRIRNPIAQSLRVIPDRPAVCYSRPKKVRPKKGRGSYNRRGSRGVHANLREAS